MYYLRIVCFKLHSNYRSCVILPTVGKPLAKSYLVDAVYSRNKKVQHFMVHLLGIAVLRQVNMFIASCVKVPQLTCNFTLL